MQKEKSPENASKLWANLAGVTGAHIDALAAQAGMHDQLTRWFNFTALTNPPVVQDILNYTQAAPPPFPRRAQPLFLAPAASHRRAQPLTLAPAASHRLAFP